MATQLLAKRILNTGAEMPAIGLGTLATNDEELRNAVEFAIDAGYRMIDTAANYFNEPSIGKAIANKINDGTVSRDDLFICTKLSSAMHRNPKQSLQNSLTNLGLDYVDMFLIHTPMAVKGFKPPNEWPLESSPYDYAKTWKELEECFHAGMTKALGLSNFNHIQIDRLMSKCVVRPANLQVECHPYWRQSALKEYCDRNDIIMTAYGPIGSPGLKSMLNSGGDTPLLEHPIITSLAEKYSKSAAQIVLRWHVERGIIPIPKSTNPNRMRNNLDVFDFDMDKEEVKSITDLSTQTRLFDLKNMFGDHPDHPWQYRTDY